MFTNCHNSRSFVQRRTADPCHKSDTRPVTQFVRVFYTQRRFVDKQSPGLISVGELCRESLRVFSRITKRFASG